MPKPMSLGAVAGAALLVRRALRHRIRASPLWPMPALEEPVSGRPRSRALRLRPAGRETVADGVVRLRLEGARLPRWEPGAHLDRRRIKGKTWTGPVRSGPFESGFDR